MEVAQASEVEETSHWFTATAQTHIVIAQHVKTTNARHMLDSNHNDIVIADVQRSQM